MKLGYFLIIRWAIGAFMGLSLTTPAQERFSDNFSSGLDNWDVYGGNWTVVDGVLSADGEDGSKVVAKDQTFMDFSLEVDVRLLSEGEAGLIFRVTNPATGVDSFSGYFAGINTANQRAVIGKMNNNWTLIAQKNIPIFTDSLYHLKAIVAGSHIRFWVNDFLIRTQEVFPKFDVLDVEHGEGSVGMRIFNTEAQFANFKVSSYTSETGPTYSNQLAAGADPGVLLHEGIYYLYCTSSANGIVVYTSTDLVNWTRESTLALHKDDSWGDRWFWAPEVVYRSGTFFMYYAVDEHLAVATADNPLGPFTQAPQEPMHTDIKEIDAHFFADDDGKNYLYFVRFTAGNEIWGAELNDDMLTIKESTLTHQFGVSQEWERDQGTVNEGPFVLKHNGIYYMTYSANHFESPAYGVGYATSDSPLGPWTKYEYNPILQSNTLVHGAGHHCVTWSPDSTEMFLVYHTHNSLTQVDPRQLAVDRLQFVKQITGFDVLETFGPTITPQPMPSVDGVAGISFKHTIQMQRGTGFKRMFVFPGSDFRNNKLNYPPGIRLFNLQGKQLPILKYNGNQFLMIQGID